jgi:WD40 repeat protein
MKLAFFFGLLWVTLAGLALPLSVNVKLSAGEVRASQFEAKPARWSSGGEGSGKDKTDLLKPSLSAPDLGRQTSPCLVPHLGIACGIVSLALSGDGRWLVTGDLDRTARLWELASGREVRGFQGHTQVVTAVALSSDGKWLVTGSGDKTARLWELSSGKEVRAF